MKTTSSSPATSSTTTESRHLGHCVTSAHDIEGKDTMPTQRAGSQRLVGVYAADGGLFGELGYILGKIRGTRSCSLCDISHGRSLKARPAWTRGLNELSVPLTVVHLNEMDADTARTAAGRSPVVVLLEDRRARILLDETDLAGCRGDPETFFSLLRGRLAADGESSN